MPKTAEHKLSSNLEQIDNESDLGMWVQTNLTRNKEVGYQSAEANKLQQYIHL